ncbi:MAG: hypothetical protein IPP32_16720 [Bacteroidetes bacterium]|nr:hypothetical protein [Bacteroidota bacterium]
MDVNLVRKICGEMPLEYLPAAKIINDKKNRIRIMIGIGVVALIGGFWCGTIREKRKHTDFKLLETDKKETDKLTENSKVGKVTAKASSKKGQNVP